MTSHIFICLFQMFNVIGKHLINSFLIIFFHISIHILSPFFALHLHCFTKTQYASENSVNFKFNLLSHSLSLSLSRTPSHVAIKWPYLPSSQHLPLSLQRSYPESVISFLSSHSSSTQRLHSAYLCFTGRPLSYMSNLMEDRQSTVQFSRLS